MKSKPKGKTRWTVRTLQEASEVIGVGTRQISRYIADGCPGRSGAYPIPAMIVWLREHPWKAKPTPAVDPLLEGPETPSLERLRSIRADQEQIKLDEMRKDSMPTASVETILAETSGLIRDAAANLERRFGAEARDEFDAVLSALEQRIEREWGAAV